MAQELRIDTWCDVCLDGGEHTEGRTMEAFGGRVVDLCEVHEKELAQPFLEVLARLGRRVEAAPATERKRRVRPEPDPVVGSLACPICEHVTARAPAMSQHLKHKHGLSQQQVFGTRCPVCGNEYQTIAALGAHLSHEHDLIGTAAGFTWAANNGDPAKVIAARRKARWGVTRGAGGA